VVSHVREPDSLRDRGERVGDTVGVDRSSVAAIDDEVCLLPRLPAEQPSLGLVLPVAPQRRDRGRRQVDRPARRTGLAGADAEDAALEVGVTSPDAAPSGTEGLEGRGFIQGVVTDA
jgi:hypothetical protein